MTPFRCVELSQFPASKRATTLLLGSEEGTVRPSRIELWWRTLPKRAVFVLNAINCHAVQVLVFLFIVWLCCLHYPDGARCGHYHEIHGLAGRRRSGRCQQSLADLYTSGWINE